MLRNSQGNCHEISGKLWLKFGKTQNFEWKLLRTCKVSRKIYFEKFD